MAKSWQRRVCEEPTIQDLTKLEVGTDYIWESRRVKACPSCGRPGVEFTTERPDGLKYGGIVHVIDENNFYRDYCVEAEFVATAPTLITFGPDGNVKDEFWPTGTKTGSGNKD